MAKTKCCPIVRVVCKRPASAKVSESFWSLKDAVTPPVHRTATVTVQKESLCSVKLGKETLVSGIKVGDKRLDEAVSRGQDLRTKRGCSTEAPALATVKPPKDVKYPDVPTEIVDRLKAKVKKVR